MSTEHDRIDDALTALYQGSVIDTADPLRVGRVRVRVPGVLDPESDWVLPAVTIGGGEKAVGFFFVPRLGAEVSIWFHQGNPDEPRYAAAHWGAPGGQSDAPTPIQEATPEEAPLIGCIETESFLLTFDERPGRQTASLIHKASGGGLIIDGVNQAMELKATTGIIIKALGAVKIDAVAITLNGRAVLPNGKPI